MKTSDFDFTLPEELIAQWPSERREASRLMVVDPRSGSILHRTIADLPGLVEPGTVIVINDSKVRRARIYGTSPTGTRVEFLLVDQLDGDRWRALCSRARRQRAGMRYAFADGVDGEILEADGEFRILRFERPIDDGWLDRFGHMPLPPYIRRGDVPADLERYQTVYARTPGSVAAPTAGLHLSAELLAALEGRGTELAPVTLHVGLGTFLPVRTVAVEEHRMHEERYEVPEASAERLNRALAEGRPILAIGTTSVRTVESAWQTNRVQAGRGATRLYIYPGYRFSVVSRLLTNFHTPRSSLILLVAAFAGQGLIQRAYETAIAERYRFFSYGDAMLISSRAEAGNSVGG